MNIQFARAQLIDSASALKKTKTLVRCALLLAAQTVLGLVAAIWIGPTIRISFGYLVAAATAMLFGPVPAMINSGLADLFVYILQPAGPYFPGFTLSAMLSGLIYGFFLYNRDKTKLSQVLGAKLVIDILINLLLNTLWLNILYGDKYAFFVTLPSRALKNLVQYPVDVALLFPLLVWLKHQFGRLRQ